MTDYYSRMQEEILKHLDTECGAMVEDLVSNRGMPDPDVHWHRGGIDFGKRAALWITNELPKIMNGE